MNQRSWLRAMVVGLLVAVGLGGWTIGRFTSDAAEPAAAQGYDLGVAGEPKPTGQLKEFTLVAREAPWEIAPGVTVPALMYNGQVPGPLIRVTEGDTVRVTIDNQLDQPTSIHWHGLHVPNDMDGVPPFTQDPIAPGQTFTYTFPASHAGTFMYHSHLNAVEQIDRGLYGPLIIDPATAPPVTADTEFTMVLSAWNTMAMPAGSGAAQGVGGAMPMDYNYFTINGKAFPAAEPWTVNEGDLVRVRLINISNLAHPMHLHGHDFTVVAKDGEPIRPDQQQTMNTLSVGAGETYDIVFQANNPGTWVFHCHELHHTENDGVEPGGLMQVIQYAGVPARSGATTPTAESSPTAMPDDMPGMGS